MFGQKFFIVTAMTLLIVVSSTIVFGGIYFGLAGFFSLIGVTYESNGALLLFVLYCMLIGIVFEVVEKVILFCVMKSAVDQKVKFIWTVVVKSCLTWIVIHTVNELMTTITLTGFAEVLTALLFVSVDVVFDDKKISRAGTSCE